MDVAESVTVFKSIAKPKKITLIGSDGKSYPLLVKPKDDMRMDSRVMELIEMVNRLLLKDAESRKRQLCIRSFHVVPLGSSGGLVEFIEGVRDIRSILLSKYIPSDVRPVMAQVTERYPHKESTLSQARKKFREEVLKHFVPPVFAEWFMETFADASSWHAARNEFTRSLAVMSIVGYVIGLGDRHLENMLLDMATGQVIHVDFNVLFNKGLTLEVPEVVPFRLTHNLVDAMGSTVFEGHFRRTCEITLQVMRDNREELMSVLKPFVFEPYAGHTRSKSTSRSMSKADTASKSVIAAKVNDMLSGKGSASVRDMERIEVHDETAVANLAVMDDRLRGWVRHSTDPSPLPLSVAGQVNHLIQVSPFTLTAD